MAAYGNLGSGHITRKRRLRREQLLTGRPLGRAQNGWQRGAKPVKQVLITGREVQNLSAHYFGIHDEEPGAGWHRELQVAVELPDLIKIEWEEEGGHPVPPLTLRPAKTDIDGYIELSDVLPNN